MGAPSYRAAKLAAPIDVCATCRDDPAFAETSTINAADTAWMIVATALVLMMTIPGLALFYCRHGAQEERAGDDGAESRGGRHHLDPLGGVRLFARVCRRRSMARHASTACSSVGMEMNGVNPAAKTIPEALFMLYQMTFAIITVALVAGSVADRMRFSA